MRVLVVEDDWKTAAFVEKALKGEGWAVDVLGDGSQALSALLATPFDAVVLGRQPGEEFAVGVSPGLSGFCTRRLRIPRPQSGNRPPGS